MTVGQQLLQLFVTGLTNGAIYALLGLGLVCIYSVTKVVNVAQGEFAVYGALLTVSLLRAGLPLWAAALMAIALVTGLGMALYQVGIASVPRPSAVTLLIVTVAAHLVLKGIALIVWGTNPYALPVFTPGMPLFLGPAVVQRQSLWVTGSLAVVVGGLWLFFRTTLAGKALRACSMNARAARLMGIRVGRMGALAFGLAAALGALGGILVAPITLATYDMGLMLGLKGFVGAVVGGLTSYPLAVAGSLVLGLFESLSAGLLSSGYRDAMAFVGLIAVLLARGIPAFRRGVLAGEEALAE